ncbi:phosphoglycolate phosphatase [Pigmentiphaga sp.]|uniref:phosphoglycolate phosphatase n=1 Tax=Pigmentiphaga sp. TaxID=1977564 RepID=UPI00128CB20B|nr:phosphoglycolate phosphatase [Pigmentiphaga sp.]MPS28796.1 phosphoglycolate phosphatase [Alcaligenaceae bacterium SAGV5]MPS52565.1 phosphoglycolate phosphatase [Alcaligenaceae bacterium SAGV3]MPT60352.1 phosphoglycolate phosphatase [Alcaligenaceae bacterium]
MKPLVLFDFDGTLADTAPDLAAAANQQRLRRGLPALPYEQLRPMASHGARGLLGVALGLTPDSPEYEACKQQFLDDYAANIAVHTVLFPGVEDLLANLVQEGWTWGIVTNKVTRFTTPLVRHLALEQHSAVVVCGDTTAHSKPHPEPLLHAAREVGVAPQSCLYVGDDQRDIVAGKAAGMKTIATAYGYCGDGVPVEAWGADTVVASVPDLLPAIRRLRPA